MTMTKPDKMDLGSRLKIYPCVLVFIPKDLQKHCILVLASNPLKLLVEGLQVVLRA